MTHPARPVEEWAPLESGMYCGARGHGASAPRLHEGVRHLTTSRSSLLFVATAFAAPILAAASGFGSQLLKICAFSERSSMCEYCRQLRRSRRQSARRSFWETSGVLGSMTEAMSRSDGPDLVVRLAPEAHSIFGISWWIAAQPIDAPLICEDCKMAGCRPRPFTQKYAARAPLSNPG
jgi:hypothetical protein